MESYVAWLPHCFGLSRDGALQMQRNYLPVFGRVQVLAEDTVFVTRRIRHLRGSSKLFLADVNDGCLHLVKPRHNLRRVPKHPETVGDLSRRSGSSQCWMALYQPLMRAFCLFLTSATIVVLSACGTTTYSPTALKTSSLISLTIAGATQLRVNQSTTFSLSQTGVQPQSVIWSVNGVAGGSTSYGTISQSGVYTAPGNPITVSIGCTDSTGTIAASALTLAILNPLPQLSSATIIGGNSTGFIVDIEGSGFISDSSVSVSDVTLQTTFLSGQELQAQMPASLATGTVANVSVANPSPGASTSNVFGLALPPTFPQTLQGCNNPNTGVPSGEWGTSGDPLYIALTWQTPLIGTPTYSTNSVFWISRENEPGDSVVMTGAFTAANKTIRIAAVPSGTLDWEPLVEQSSLVIAATQQGTTGLSFVIPSQLPSGVFGFEIQDGSAPPVFELANVPAISWVLGVSNANSPDAMFNSTVQDCSAEPGGTLRVFGKNFHPYDQMIFESSSGTLTSIAPSKGDVDSLTATIPNSLSPGSYYFWVGSSPWSATSSSVSRISIAEPSSGAVTHIHCTSLIGDGLTDNAPALQTCLDANAPSAASNSGLVIDIPGGTFVLGSGIVVHPHEFLEGTSLSTQILGMPVSSDPIAWLTLSQYTGLRELSISTSSKSSIVLSSSTDGNPTHSGHVKLSNVQFKSTAPISDNNVPEVGLYGPDIQVYGSSFTSSSSVNLVLNFGDGAIFSGNYFDNATALNGIEASQNVVIENNEVTSRNGPTNIGGTAFTMGRPFCAYCNSMVSQNFYIGYNNFHDMGAPNNQVVVQDGGAGAYYGYVASSTPDVVTLANDPTWVWVGDTNPESMSIVIIAGTGIGQHATLTSCAGRVLTLDRPWIVTPDSSSLVVILSPQKNITVSHNTFSDIQGMPIFLDNTLENSVEDNLLTDAGQGIFLWAYGPYGGPAAFGTIIDSDILRNTIYPGSARYLINSVQNNVAGIGISNGYGTIISGAVLRDNLVTQLQTIYNTNGDNGINANVIESNQATWIGPNPPIEGFLIRNNAP